MLKNKNDGSHWICGEGIGTEQKTVSGEADYTVTCSSEFSTTQAGSEGNGTDSRLYGGFWHICDNWFLIFFCNTGNTDRCFSHYGLFVESALACDDDVSISYVGFKFCFINDYIYTGFQD